MELTHLQLWAEMMKKYEGRDPAELFGTTLTVDFQFTENKEVHPPDPRTSARRPRAAVAAGRRPELGDDGRPRKDWPSYVPGNRQRGRHPV